MNFNEAFENLNKLYEGKWNDLSLDYGMPVKCYLSYSSYDAKNFLLANAKKHKGLRGVFYINEEDEYYFFADAHDMDHDMISNYAETIIDVDKYMMYDCAVGFPKIENFSDRNIDVEYVGNVNFDIKAIYGKGDTLIYSYPTFELATPNSFNEGFTDISLFTALGTPDKIEII